MRSIFPTNTQKRRMTTHAASADMSLMESYIYMWRCAKTLLQTQFRAICVHAYYAEDDFRVTTQNNCHQLRVEEFKHSKNRIFMSYIYRNAYRQFTIDSCIQLNTPFRGLPPSQLKCLSSYHRKDSKYIHCQWPYFLATATTNSELPDY